MLHEHEEPDFGILRSLEHAGPSGRLALVPDGIALGTLVRKGSFFWCQPPCCQRFVWQDEEARYSDNEGDDALDDKEPLPARDSGL